jgi:hypothetical protein
MQLNSLNLQRSHKLQITFIFSDNHKTQTILWINPITIEEIIYFQFVWKKSMGTKKKFQKNRFSKY